MKHLSIFACAAALLAGVGAASGAFPTLSLKPVCLKQINSPTAIVNAGDGSGRLFICDQPGKIYIFKNGMLQPTPFLDLSNPAGGPVLPESNGYSERGLLCVVFHPGYSNPASPGYRKFYLNYNKPYVAGVDAPPLGPTTGTNGSLAGDCVTIIAEFQVSANDPNVADPTSERRLMTYTQPQSNHNGGQLEFGPEIGPNGERYLYIGVGDGGSQQDNNLGHTGGDNASPRPTNGLGNAQDKTRLFGKILRIDPLGTNGPGGQYGIPADNPFIGAGGGVREEIYSYGMRNPWRFSFDKHGVGHTNRLFCGDVGGDRTEEVDLIVSGGNYGWRYLEGTEMPAFSSGAVTNPMPNPGGTMIDPIARYAHPGQTVGSPALPQLGRSVTGGYIYRGSAIPALQGKYIFGDYGSTSGASNGRMMGLEETAPGSGAFTLTEVLPLTGTNPIVGQRILTFGEDENGEIYVGMKSNSGVLAPGTDGLPAGGIYQLVPAQSFTTTLEASQDNTIFSEDAAGSSFTSDGLGYLYAGKTGTIAGPFLRRALVAFNIAGGLPGDALITAAQLKLNLTKAGPSADGTSTTIHRLNETWGEGSSENPEDKGYGAPATTGDATWAQRFYNTSPWTAAGGTYVATASATATINSADSFVMWASNPQLIADVQGWVSAPSSNAGWIIRGTETMNNTACQFSSVQKGGTPPALQVTYLSAPALTQRETWLRTYFPVGQYVDDADDPDDDGISNKFEYAFGYSPTDAASPGPANPPVKLAASRVGANVIFTITFRRDPRATELTYILETSSDVATWTMLAQSAGGAIPTGSGFLSEADAPGEAPIKIVTAQETVPANQNRFVRVRVLP